MRKLYIFMLSLTGLFFLPSQTSHAIPAFTRKYEFNCNKCHIAYPKLNEYGQRFRDNGYQQPGQEELEKNVLEIAPPLAIRSTTGLSAYDIDRSTTVGFNIFRLDLLSAGVLHKNISFLLIYTPRIDEPAGYYKGSNNGMYPSQLASIESANLVFGNVIQDALNLRIGRFEPAYQAFSFRRSLYLLQPYEIYRFSKPWHSFVFADNQIGLEATGHFRSGFKYGLGVVNGNGANPDNNTNKDFYLNLFQTLGRGDGQSAGQRCEPFGSHQRIGAFGYLGWQPTNLPGKVTAPTGETSGYKNKQFYRLGGDLSLNWRTFNLQALFMQGVDDKAFNTYDPSKDYTYTGGFAQLDWASFLNGRLIASVLYNWVRPPCRDESSTINAYSALLRYYLGGGTAANIALHAEYTHKETGEESPFKEDVFTVLVDFDF
jgi:hypothetical protein